MPNDDAARCGSAAAPPVCHVSAIPSDVAGRAAIAPALDLVAGELEPMVATFVALSRDGCVRFAVAHGDHLPPAELVDEVGRWEARLRDVDPLAPRAIAGVAGPVATLADVAGGRRLLRDAGPVRDAYEDIGVIDDVRLLIRERGRLVAAVALWRPLGAGAWTRRQLRRLEALQPLVELAYVSAACAASGADDRLPGTLTPRERQVTRLLAAGATNAEIARDLRVSPHTAKRHATAVLAKLGVASRRELAMLYPGAAAAAAPTGTAGGRAGHGAHPPPAAAGDPAIRLEGDEAPGRLLGPVLAWSAEHVGAVVGGCALVSARSEPVAQAWAGARAGAHEWGLPVARRVQGELVPRSRPSLLVRDVDADSSHPAVVELDGRGAPPDGDRLGELVAGAGLERPLVAVLRVRGRVTAVVWVCRDARSAVDRREAGRKLRAVHPLLEIAHVAGLAGDDGAGRRSGGLAQRGLTGRELAVARLALDGHGNAAIAGRLGISEATVKRHMSRVLAKCGVRSRTQLIALLGDSRGG